MSARSPCPVTSLGAASAAAVAWRLRGDLYLTVVVKASFSLASEARMTPSEPDPVASDEEPDPSGVGLRTAGDLAPYLGQIDVWLTGQAELPRGFAAPEAIVSLTVVRGGEIAVDKHLELDTSERAGAARDRIPVRGLGPLSREWPLREKLRGDLDPRHAEAPILDIPPSIDWRFFQTAPPDQRLDALDGTEWLVLGGMFAHRPRLRTQLPVARGVARLYRRGEAAPRAGEPVALAADTLQVDLDRRRCAILWRGNVGVAGEEELAALHVVAGIEAEGRPAAWTDPFASAPEPGSLEDTLEVSSTAARERLGPATPFVPVAAPPLARVARRRPPPRPAPAIAMRGHPPNPPPRAIGVPPGRASAGSFDHTLDLTDAVARGLVGPATPFEQEGAAVPEPAPAVSPPAPTPISFDGTLDLTDLRTRGGVGPALPFAPAAVAPPTPAAGPRAPPSPPRPQDPGSFDGTLDLSEAVARLRAAPATPFEPRLALAPAEADPTPPPVIGLPELAPDASPESPGEAFLAAMAEAGMLA